MFSALAFLATLWLLPLCSAAVPSECANMCAESTWQSELCYPDYNNDTLCYYHKLQYCNRAPQTSAEANCKTKANLVPCVTSNSNTCSTRADFFPSCGNFACEVGEPWTCPEDCAFYSDSVLENNTHVYNTCPGLNPLERQYIMTFDDGPTPYTATALHHLNAANVNGAFFTVGVQMDANVEVAVNMSRQGHILGSHSYSHFNFSLQTPDSIRNDVALFDEIFSAITGFKPRFWRPPYGSFTDAVVQVLANVSLDVIGWNVDTFDYETPDSIPTILSNTQAAMLKHPGFSHLIVLGHDIYSGTVGAIPSIIQYISSKGFTPTRLDKCIYNATGISVYSAVRNISPQLVRRLVLPLGINSTLSQPNSAASLSIKQNPTILALVLLGVYTFLI